MDVKKAMEKHSEIKKTVRHNQLVPYEIEIIEENKQYLIALFLKGEEPHHFAIYYKVGEEVLYTECSFYSMKKRFAVLNTRKLIKIPEGVIDMEFFLKEIENEKEEEILEKALKRLIKQVKNHPMVKIREVTGLFKWYFQNEDGRRELQEKEGEKLCLYG